MIQIHIQTPNSSNIIINHQNKYYIHQIEKTFILIATQNPEKMETVGEVFCTSPHPFHHQQSNQNSFCYQFQDRQQGNWWKSYESEEESSSTNEEEDDVLERFLKELDLKGHELINKLVSKLQNNLPFEEDFRETCHHLRGKSASHMLEKIVRKMGRDRKRGFERRERGVDLEEELKNERFKVKTMNVVGSGVVK